MVGTSGEISDMFLKEKKVKTVYTEAGGVVWGHGNFTTEALDAKGEAHRAISGGAFDKRPSVHECDCDCIGGCEECNPQDTGSELCAESRFH